MAKYILNKRVFVAIALALQFLQIKKQKSIYILLKKIYL